MSAIVQIEETYLVASEVAHFRVDRGHSYTKLVVTMKDGASYTHRDWNGSVSAAVSQLRSAIEALP